MTSKKTINIIGLFLIFIFIFITAYTSLYAAGYRLNWHWPLNFNQILSKTGMLTVKSTPRNVNVNLKRDTGGLFIQKDIKENFQTPAKIQNLLPGKYQVSLEKENYWPIIRNIEIYPNQVTDLSNIFLFKKSLPLNIYISQKGDEDLIINEEKTKLIFLSNGKIIDLDSESVKVLEHKNIKYLGNNILLSNNNLYNLESNQVIFNLKEILNDDFKNLQVNLENDELFYNTAEKIAYTNLENQEKTTILEGNKYINFLIKDNYIFSVEKNNTNYFLRTYNKSTLLRQRSIIIPRGDYEFYNESNHLINLYDNNHKRLILIDNSHFLDEQKIIAGVDKWKWFANNLIWQNGQEIYRFNFKTQQTHLLLRLSESISDFIWQTKENYLIYSTKNSINIVYFKENRNDVIEILRAQNIGPLFIDNTQSILYFYAQIDNQSGVFKLLLH